MIDFRRPVSIDTWLHYWMPWIRKKLDLPNDDLTTIEYWSERGLKNDTININIDSSKPSLSIAAGPNLEVDFQRYISSNLNEVKDTMNIISADGATVFLLENNILPDIVMSDLDGLSIQSMKQLLNMGSQLLILVHGDNQELVENVINSDIDVDQIVWCTQGEPKYSFRNTLGFTDGDRGIALATTHGTPVWTLGYNLTADIIGRYSKRPYDRSYKITSRKRIKLYIASKIIQWLGNSFDIRTFNATSCPGLETSKNDFLKLINH